MKTLELLMSVMHQDDFSLPKRSNVKGNLLVVNQCDQEWYVEQSEETYNWRMFYTKERGLSKSRNMAIANAKGDICKLCDDDETLVDNYREIILKAYEELPDADVIVFNINRINYKMKKTYYTIDKVRLAPGYRSYQSSMITFKLKQIKETNIRFNENFGSGSKFGGGEETLFLKDIRKAGLKIYEYPAVISTLDYGRFGSQWFHGYTDKYFYNLGVYSQYVNPDKVFSQILWGLYQAIKLRREKLNPFKIIKWRLAGAKGFKNGKLSYEEYIKSKK